MIERSSTYPTIESIDTKETWDLVGDDLAAKATEYIRRNLGVFVGG